MMHNRPSVVLIVLDSLRRDHVSCYGYERRTTPHIDQIAAQGILFRRAYATSCWTLPSHASLFTGLYPSQHRADFDTRWLGTKHVTLAEFLGKLGYRSACISCNGFVAGETGLDRGFDYVLDVEGLGGGGSGRAAKLVRYAHGRWRRWTHRDRGARQATKAALQWMGEHRSAPFFLFLNYMDCHLPYRLRRPQRHHFVAPGDRKRVDRIPQDPFAQMAGRITLSDQELADLRALYDGSLFYLDQQIGILDDHLRELGLQEQTIFVVTSDHGESFGEHGLMDHQYGLYEHLLAVPLVVRLPGRRSAGEQRNEMVQLVDMFPTISGLVPHGDLEIELPAWSGQSILDGPVRDAVLAEYLVPNLRAFRRRFPMVDTSQYDVAMRSIQVGKNKLIWRGDGGAELYDLERDPGERLNLAPERPRVVDRLRARLAQCLGEWPELDWRGVDQEEMQAVRERLEELGYL